MWIVKFYKGIIKMKDDAYAQYLTKKNLLKTIVDIFLENPNKTNLLHSIILELFDYLTKEPSKKINHNMIACYSEQLFRHPKYECYFRAFIECFESKEEIKYPNQ